jgi:secreted Zn-dependent insulinase-like peptidase
VLSEHLHESLGRFSQFFIAPLFKPSVTQCEMNAVNSDGERQ